MIALVYLWNFARDYWGAIVGRMVIDPEPTAPRLRMRPAPAESGRAFLGRGSSYGENSESGGPWC